MQASSIIELNGRGIPAVLHTAKIVDVCAYLKSNSTPAALVLSDRGDVRGVMSEADIIGAAGRLGSSVMQMMAGELMREQAPVCQSDTAIVELLEILSETSSDFVLVTEGGVVKGLITFQDVAELLTAALSGGDNETGHAVEAEAAVADHAVAGAPAGEALPQVEMPASEPAPQAEIPAAAAPAETPLAPPQQAQMADAGQMPPVHAQPVPQQGLEIAAQPTQPMVAADHAQYAPAPEPVAAVHAAAPVMPPVHDAAAVPEAAPVQPAAPVQAGVEAPPTVASLLQGQPQTAAPPPQAPVAHAHEQPATTAQAEHKPISAAAAAARAIAARMQAPQAEVAAPGSQSSEGHAPGAAARAGWASFKVG